MGWWTTVGLNTTRKGKGTSKGQVNIPIKRKGGNFEKTRDKSI